MSKAILDSVQTRLAASTIATTLGNRFALSIAETNTELPNMVYDVETIDSQKIFGGHERYEATFVFTFNARSSYGTSIHTLSSQLETALTATTLSPTGFDRLTFTKLSNGVPSFADDAWTMSDRYRAVGFKIS